MTKQELKTKLEQKGLLRMSGSRDPLWVEAFKMFNQGRSPALKMGCGSCYSKVREWLQS